MQFGGNLPLVLHLDGDGHTTMQVYPGSTCDSKLSHILSANANASVRCVLQFAALHIFAEDAVGTLHSFPVVFVSCAAGQADLVMLSVAANARPRETVCAGVPEDELYEFQWVTPWLRLFHWSSQREKNGLWWPSRSPFKVDSSMLGGCDFDRNVSTHRSLFAGRGP